MNKFLKNLTVILFAMSILIGSFGSPVVRIAEAFSSYTAHVTASSLHMRSGPGTKYRHIRYLYKNYKVSVVGKSGSWYRIKYGGKTGYVSGKYIKKSSTSKSKPKSKPKFKSYTAYVTATALNMRSGPSTKNKKVRILHKNNKVTVYGKSGSWYKIKYGGKTGYVSGKYIKKSSTSKSKPKPKPKFKSYTAYVTATALNMRSGPSTKNKKVRTLHKNNKITVYGKSGSWYKIKYGSASGYVSAKYVKKGTPPKPKASRKVQSFKKYYVYIGYDNLKVYKTPSTKSAVIRTLRERTKVSVTGNSGDWRKIQYGGTTGYVNKSDLTTSLGRFNPPVGKNGKFGIDVSHHQERVDFNAVKRAGNMFVILKASEGTTFKDNRFVDYAVAAKKAGLSVSAYHFFRAKTATDAKKEASNFATAVNAARKKGVNIQYLYIDVETSNNIPGSHLKSTLTANTITFLNEMRLRHHMNQLGIYSNLLYFNKYLDLAKIKQSQKSSARFLIWLARYRGQSTYIGSGYSADLWQFTSNGQVSGVSGAVDRNISYYN
ncbi:SH3 domain-containing protein [Sporolactobacillus sp. CPB3-1]|uniref:Lysozyme n=1 Tax=Sporolactobacillus mangiferae TaxID=2940498 RepID=A0ABT0MDI3_9BACL|nr:SH3 domain-containing protein [Sporolactobacillus mangiferae]MCL1632932.1 SH3 domain-containing protein [Sporolactobacillus mangiferae]